eukprot:gene18026-biopygen12935
MPAPRPRHACPIAAYSPRHARAMPAPRPRHLPVPPGSPATSPPPTAPEFWVNPAPGTVVSLKACVGETTLPAPDPRPFDFYRAAHVRSASVSVSPWETCRSSGNQVCSTGRSPDNPLATHCHGIR